MITPRSLACALTLTIAAAVPAAAQTLVGRVLDEVRESPVPGALVKLLDADGGTRAEALADSAGRFVLAPPRAGGYYLEATRVGYRLTRSPLLALSERGPPAPLDLMMTPAPVGLEGLAVEIDAVTRATDDLRISGIRPADLGNRFIERDDIEALEVKPDLGRVLEWGNIPGMRVIRPENQLPGSDLGLCVSMARSRTGQGLGRCAMVVLDGVPITGEVALAIDPEVVDAMALLVPVEATMLYGVRGEGGVLMIWTQRGGPVR